MFSGLGLHVCPPNVGPRRAIHFARWRHGLRRLQAVSLGHLGYTVSRVGFIHNLKTLIIGRMVAPLASRVPYMVVRNATTFVGQLFVL
jgi:hypothetical protein